jgi:HNH endonuclease
MAPTPEKMKGTLRYDPITGLFYKNGVRVGSIRRDGYITISAGSGIQYLSHRLAWRIMYGKWPIEIDHIDGNRSNNSILNLRDVAYSGLNQANTKFHREDEKRKRPPERDYRRRRCILRS